MLGVDVSFGIWILDSAKKNMATMKGLQVLKLSRLAAWCAIPTVFCQDRAWTSKNGPSFDSFVWQQHVQWLLFQKRDFMRCPCHHVHVFECNGLKQSKMTMYLVAENSDGYSLEQIGRCSRGTHSWTRGHLEHTRMDPNASYSE